MWPRSVSLEDSSNPVNLIDWPVFRQASQKLFHLTHFNLLPSCGLGAH